MAEKYVIVLDSMVEGWQAQREYTEENPEGVMLTFDTEEEAQAEIDADFKSFNEARIDCGDRPEDCQDEPEEFVVPLSEYIEGRKTIFTGSGK